MDKPGRWTLSPAFDITYSFNPAGAWTASHQMAVNEMAVNGKRDNFVLDDFKACAETTLMNRGRAENIIDQVQATVSQRKYYTNQAAVVRSQRDQIQSTLRLTSL